MLNTILTGTATDSPPLLIAHGLFGSARNWGSIAKRMAADRQVITVDMRNHGESPWFDTHSYPDMAADLAEVIAANGGQADVLGHSMGGKAAMMLALTAPERINRLVVADIAPVAYRHSQQPLIDAMRGVDLSAVETRSDADEMLARAVESRPVRAFLLQSLDVKNRRWQLNLDVLEAEMSKILGWPQVEGRFDGPTLFLSGAESDYVRPEFRDDIAALFPKARFVSISGAGHWLHAEKPREFITTLQTALPAAA